ncbi:MAG: type I phosphomannose isomerase catalytic subunit, partial [bacterium]
MTNLIYPLLFQPVYKDYLWGGNRIQKKYGRKIPPGTYAESWEISDRPEGMSVVTNGRFAGRSLGSLVTEFGARLVGDDFAGRRFPLLIKLIDARLRLSVQVHPSDANAAAVKGEPKTEMWYVLDACAGARAFVGLKKAVTGKSFDLAVRTGCLASMLKPVKMETDSAILVPGGTVHSIGEGLLILEVQQNSNTTFRVYDWGRVGQDGKARPLHVAEAKKSIIWAGRSPVRARLRVTARAGRNIVRE